MKKTKRFFSIVTVLALSFALMSPSFATYIGNSEQVSNGDTTTFTYICSPAEINAELSAQMKEIDELVSNLTRDVGEAYVEWGDPKTLPASGYPGNQPKNGTYFSSAGGSFSYSDTGGSSVDLAFSFNAPFASVSLSVPLGKITSGGSVSYNFNVPENSPGYYKLYITKWVEVKPYITYYRTGEGAPWEVALKSYIKSTVKIDHEIEKV